MLNDKKMATLKQRKWCFGHLATIVFNFPLCMLECRLYIHKSVISLYRDLKLQIEKSYGHLKVQQWGFDLLNKTND